MESIKHSKERTMQAILLALAAVARVGALAPTLAPTLRFVASARAAPRSSAVVAVYYPDDDEEEMYFDDGGELELPDDMDLDFVRNKLEAWMNIDTEYDTIDNYPKPSPWDHLASIVVLVFVVVLVVKQCARLSPTRVCMGSALLTFYHSPCARADLIHTGGGLVIVPEGDAIGIYNFKELQQMEGKRLLDLGLPTPATPPPAFPPLFRWSNLLAGFDATVPP